MIDPFWLSLAAKMIASGVLVMAVALVVARTGPFAGAMVATLPLSAGPAYVFIGLDHGPEFVAQSALVSLAVNAAIAPFIVVYALMAQRFSLLASLGVAFGAWVLSAWLILQSAWTFPVSIAANLLAFSLGMVMTRRFLGGTFAKRFTARWWDLPLRALLVMGVTLAVVLGGKLLGPTAAGMAALVPVILTSVAIVLHPRQGGSTAAAVFANGLPGMFGFAAALVFLHLAAVPLGLWPALALALAISVSWNAMLILVRYRVLLRAAK
jgi:hypothetical protein